jgi:hypothetical protein
MNSTVDIILGAFPPDIRQLANTVRIYLREQLKGVEEQPDFPARMIAYGYGAGYNDMICTILLSRTTVKIGFYKGTSLPDPHKLLTGTGKVHRYVEIRSAKDLSPQLDQLLRAAFGAYLERTATDK